MLKEVEKTRVDKWLWSVRIFKSRSIAAHACRDRHVKVNDVALKPSANIQVGDIVQVRKNGFLMKYRIDKVIEKRVGAPLAVECYTDLTPEEELNKYKSWFSMGKAAEQRERGLGRPTKRERRDIDKFKDEEDALFSLDDE